MGDTDWRTRMMPDGRVVECVDVAIVALEPPNLVCDVTVAVDEVLQTLRVSFNPDGGSETPHQPKNGEQGYE